MSNHDASGDPLDALGRLPAPDCDPERSRRILSSALEVLAGNRPAVPYWYVTMERLYCSIIEPAWVAVLGAAFLVLAFIRAVSVLQ